MERCANCGADSARFRGLATVPGWIQKHQRLRRISFCNSAVSREALFYDSALEGVAGVIFFFSQTLTPGSRRLLRRGKYRSRTPVRYSRADCAAPPANQEREHGVNSYAGEKPQKNEVRRASLLVQDGSCRNCAAGHEDFPWDRPATLRTRQLIHM